MKRESVKYILKETETERRGNQEMRRRQEEHFSTYLNWFKPNNLCNTFTPISTGFDSVIIWVHFSIRLAIVCSEWKEFAGSVCFKINRNAGLTSPEENNPAQISNKWFRASSRFMSISDGFSRKDCADVVNIPLLLWRFFLEHKSTYDKFYLGGMQEMKGNSGKMNVRYLQLERSTFMLRCKCVLQIL